MARLDIERQEKLQPKRLAYALERLQKLGFKVDQLGDATLAFEFKGATIRFYPYSGWATGQTIKDCRGLNNLLNQLH